MFALRTNFEYLLNFKCQLLHNLQRNANFAAMKNIVQGSDTRNDAMEYNSPLHKSFYYLPEPKFCCQASMPPVRFFTFSKPSCSNICAAIPLRLPLLQYATISSFFQSSIVSVCILRISPSGSNTPPILKSAFSDGSRTSSR